MGLTSVQRVFQGVRGFQELPISRGYRGVLCVFRRFQGTSRVFQGCPRGIKDFYERCMGFQVV